MSPVGNEASAEKRPGYFAQAAESASLTMQHSGADSAVGNPSMPVTGESDRIPRSTPVRSISATRVSRSSRRKGAGANVVSRYSLPSSLRKIIGLVVRLRNASARAPGNQCACMSMVMGALRLWAVLLAEFD
jgi:hypothetical protein